MLITLRCLAAAVLTLTLAVPLMAQAVRTESYQGRDVVAGEIIVRFRPPATNAQIQAIVAPDLDIASIQAVGGTGLMLLQSRGRDVAALLQDYSGRPEVLYAEPNYLWQADDIPNDPDFGLQYGLQNTGQAINGQAGLAGADIRAVPAWDITQGSQSIVVGVVDSGVAYNHPDLAVNMWSAPTAFSVNISGQIINCAAGTHGFNAIARNCDPLDDNIHGTHVAGIIGASGNNGIGISGVSRVSSIMGLKFLNAGGSGSTTDAIAAIEFAVQVKALFGAAANVRILNNSWGGGGFSQALLDAINLANTNNMLFLAAAGNSSSNNDTVPHYPSSFDAPNIISIAATDNRDSLASFSSYGATSVHMGAPGVNIYSTYPPNVYRSLSGTSMATPMVAGAAALVLSSCNLTTAALKTNLLNAVDPVPALLGKTTTGGRLNVHRSLTSCSGTPSPEFTLALTPPITNVLLNAPATYTVTVTPVNGFTGTVSLAATGLPSGMTASFSPASISGSGSSTLTLTTIGVPAGGYLLTVTGTSGSISRIRFLGVTVGPPLIQSIKPASGIAGMTVKAVVQGTALDSGASAITFSGTGITPTLGAGIPFGGLPVTLAIAADAPAGRQTFTVTTATGVSPSFDGFTVIVPESISPGQTIAGTLSSSDPIDPLYPGYYADYYKLILGTPTQVTIDMRSSNFAPWIGLISSSGSVLYSNGSTNPQINAALAAGTYYIDASSSAKGATGSYTLSINVLPVITAVAPPFGTQGSVVDVTLSGNRFGSPVTVDAGSGVTVSNVVVGSSKSLTATFTVSAGATANVRNVTVTTAEGTSNTKAFSIFPSIPSISLGQTISGALSTTDGRNPFFAPSYADMYRLTLGATTPVIIDVRSTEFDTTLRLLWNSGALLIYDNNGGGGTNSRIFTTLAAGTYYLDLSSVFAGATGAYTISVNVLPAITAIAPNSGARGSAVTVTLSGNRFSAPVTVDAGSGITVSNVSIANPTSLTATFTISASATLADHNVTVTTPDGTSNRVVFSIVNQPPPTLTTWKTTGSMSAPRRDHTATLLADGKVLIVGWITMAELYDPIYGTFIPIGNTLCQHLQGSTATRLQDGRVLIVGGSGDQLCAEIYDPATGAFSLTGSPLAVHNFQTATLLSNGTVLIVGGQSSTPPQTHAIAELYDPATGSFTLTGSLNDARGAHTAVLLPNGKVLIAGGNQTTTPGNAVCLKSAELYDPIARTFSRTGNMTAERCGLYWTAAPVLSTGKVLIAGNQYIPSELFDPSTEIFSTTGSLTVPRSSTSANLLADGQVLVLGGFTVDGNTSATAAFADVYNPATGVFGATSRMGIARLEHTATLLLDGKVLVTGGWGGTTELSSAELYADAPPNNAITPISGQQGLSVNVTLVGNHFLSPMTVNAGAGITVSNVNVVSSQLATATFAISAGATLGARGMTVATSAGTSGSVTFTVLPPAPTLTSISPASGAQGTNVSVSLTGTNFFAGMTVDAGANITTGSVVVASATSATAMFAIGSGATLGARGVTVSTATGTSGPVTFTVLTTATPTLTGISPSSGGQTLNVAVTLTGTNFGPGLTVNAGAQITVNSINVVSGTSATAIFAIGASAALGPRNVTITTAGGTSGAVTFTVLPPPPTLLSVNPSSGAQGSSVAVTLTGTNFVSGLTVNAGSNITGADVVVLSGTSATATLAIGGAMLGARNVTVSTASGTSGPVTFTVVAPPPPTLSSVSPPSGGQGATLAVTLTGTNFVPGMTVDAGSNITAGSVVVSSGTSATATFAIASSAVLGSRGVTVATAGGTSGPATFTVLPPRPVLTTWKTVGSMSVPRRDHTATLLADGKVLIAGWFTRAAELFDPIAETFSPTGNTLCDHGSGSTATRLLSGKVLIIGGSGDQLCAEIYDPTSGTFSLTGTPKAVHNFQTATLLPNGKVLIAAGQSSAGSQTHALAELYDPANGSFTLTGSLNEARSAHTAALLPNGKILIAGGIQTTTSGSGTCLNSAELYDPVAGTFTRTGNMSAARCGLYWSESPVLSTGKVFIAGDSSSIPELFDPATGTFSTTSSMTVPRTIPTASLLPNGKVVVSGGYTAAGPIVTSSAELYDPAGGTFGSTSGMATARQEHTATVLLSGKVLVTGGYGGTTELSSAELYSDAPPNSPISPVSGAQGLSLNVTLVGNNFLSPMTIAAGAGITVSNVNVVSSHQVTATFAISATATLGARGVTVTTAGGTSGSVTFTVNPAGLNSAPAISSLSPANATAGAAGFTLTVNGSNFVSGSVVRWNGADRATTFVNSTRLTASISGTDIAAAGIAQVTVFNPGSGGGASNALSFNVNALRVPSRPTGAVLEKWTDSTFPITWRLNPAKGTNVTGSRELIEIFRSAFAAWDSVSTAQISFLEGPATTAADTAFDQINSVSVLPTPFGSDVQSLTVLYSFAEPGVDQFGRIIEFPGQILEADILFNPAVQFSTDVATPTGRIDLQSLATHEVGHFLGLDDSGLLSSVMSRTLAPGTNYPRALSDDDRIRVSNRYPTSAFSSATGSFSGVVRNSSGTPVYGAHVVIVDSTGRPVTSTISEIDGAYQVHGLIPGSYSAYAEPLDEPLTPGGVPSLVRMNPGTSPMVNFTTRFNTTSAGAALTIAKTAGDNQKENAGKLLPIPLEVQVKDSTGNPVAGVSVFFTPTGGGGTVVPIRATTDAEGKARTRAYLGTGAAQTFRASVASATVTFAATLP